MEPHTEVHWSHDNIRAYFAQYSTLLMQNRQPCNVGDKRSFTVYLRCSARPEYIPIKICKGRDFYNIKLIA